MAIELYRVEIPIEVTDRSPRALAVKTQQVSALEANAKTATRSLQNLGKTNVSPTIRARDHTSSTIRSIRGALASLAGRTFFVTIAARNLASGAIAGLGGALGALTSMPAMLGGLLATGGLAMLGRHAIGLSADLEQAQIAFATMLRSERAAKGEMLEFAQASELATGFLRKIEDFAAKTPFEFPELRTSAQRLMAFGFTSEQIIPMMTQIGNAASALGGGADSIQGITRALGQIRAKGRVQTEELLQLQERGIPALEDLAKGYGVTTAEMQNMVQRGVVPANKSIRILLEGFEARFGGMMEKGERTAIGMFNTMKENLDAKLLRPLGDGLLNAFRPGMTRLTGWLNSSSGGAALARWGAGLKRIGEDVGNFFATSVEYVVSSVADFLNDPAFINAPDKFGFAIGRAFDWIVERSGPLGQWLKWFRDTGWPGIKGAAEGFWSFVVGDLLPALGGLKDRFVDIKSWIVIAAAHAGRLGSWENLKGAWDNLWQSGSLVVQMLTGDQGGTGLNTSLSDTRGEAESAGAAFFGITREVRDFTAAIKGALEWLYRFLTPFREFKEFMKERGGLAGIVAAAIGRGGEWLAGGEYGGGYGGESLTVPQIAASFRGMGFSEEEIAAACGPIAAAGIGRAFGIATADPATMLKNARQYGWSEKGMGGSQAFVKMLQGELGVAAEIAGVEATARVARDLMIGGVAAFSTAKHYFLAQGYDPQTAKFDLGESGQSVYGQRYMTLAEMQEKGGSAGEWITPKGQPLGGGRFAGGGGRFAPVGAWASAAGLDPEGARIMMAIAKTEGAFPNTMAVGDQGQSFGPLQFHRSGQLANFAEDMGMSLDEAARFVQMNPQAAVTWAARGYLGKAIRAGRKLGLSGSALAEYAQRRGQVSVEEGVIATGANYREMFENYQAAGAPQAAYAAAQGLAPGGDVGGARGAGGSVVLNFPVTIPLIGLDEESARQVGYAVSDFVADALARELPHILQNVQKAGV